MTDAYFQASNSGWWDSSYLVPWSDPKIFDISGYGAYFLFAPTIPKGAEITYAYLDFYVYEASGGDHNPYIRASGEDVDNAVAPTSRSDAVSKTRTTANEETVVDVYGPAGYRYIDVTAIVAEIIARAGWVSGNNMQILIDAIDFHYEYARAYGYNQPNYPYIYVSYTYTPPKGGSRVQAIGLGF